VSKTVLTDKHIKFIRDNYMIMSGATIGKKLGISRNVVNDFKQKQGWQVSREQISKWRAEKLKGRTSFSKKEDRFIKDNYLVMPIKRLAAMMNRSYSGVTGRLDNLGLEIPEELRKERKNLYTYKKGCTPLNKGKKLSEFMSAEAIAKCAVHRFKKGHRPANAKPIGTVIIKLERKSDRYYKHITQATGKMKLLHKVVWEDANGPVPANHCIWFKDGNSMNVVLENLELITRKENLRRNAIHHYPKDLKEVIYLKNKIKKKINEKRLTCS
jgi:hypothetical protein